MCGKISNHIHVIFQAKEFLRPSRHCAPDASPPVSPGTVVQSHKKHNISQKFGVTDKLKETQTDVKQEEVIVSDP